MKICIELIKIIIQLVFLLKICKIIAEFTLLNINFSEY